MTHTGVSPLLLALAVLAAGPAARAAEEPRWEVKTYVISPERRVFSWMRPTNVRYLLLQACGGGGGGAAGLARSPPVMGQAGGGGGGAPVTMTFAGPLTADRYTVELGVGGEGGDSTDEPGKEGGETTFRGSTDGTEIVFVGGAGGHAAAVRSVRDENRAGSYQGNRIVVDPAVSSGGPGSVGGAAGAPGTRSPFGKGGVGGGGNGGGGGAGMGNGGRGGNGDIGRNGAHCAGGGGGSSATVTGKVHQGGSGGHGWLRLVPLTDTEVILQQALNSVPSN